MNQIYRFILEPDWNLINKLSQIDRFGGAWIAIEKREGQTLRQLKSIATVRSVGASTRIEGSALSDNEVDALLKNLDISKLEQRDQQEVVGYFETLGLISASFRDIPVTENMLKQMHKELLKYSKKDEWHRGGYKQVSNAVEATNPDGSRYIIFKTTDPGMQTEAAMRDLVEWYSSDKETHPLVRAATFIYEFLSIHPFQDGNGRLSRLLATLLLLKQDYAWIEYISFEQEIEDRKSDYYTTLMNCQRQRPGENIRPWILFFLDCLENLQANLEKKLETKNNAPEISPRAKMIYDFIHIHPGARTGEIAQRLIIPLPTVKKDVADMVLSGLLGKQGTGAGTNYSVTNNKKLQQDLLLKLTNDNRKKEFQLMNPSSFISIKKIILAPKFEWAAPDEWVAKLYANNLQLSVEGVNKKGGTASRSFLISTYNSPYYFRPVFDLADQIEIPGSLWNRMLLRQECPVDITITLTAATEHLDFDVMLVYDEM